MGFYYDSSNSSHFDLLCIQGYFAMQCPFQHYLVCQSIYPSTCHLIVEKGVYVSTVYRKHIAYIERQST